MQTFPYSHLDVILMEAWLEGDSTEGPFQWIQLGKL